MVIYRKSHLVQGKLAQASQLFRLEGISSPRRVGCLRMKAFHGLGEPDADLGELKHRNIQKMAILPPFLVVFVPKSNNQTST